VRILLLGKTGFVGRNLVEALAQDSSLDIYAPSHRELDVLDERAVVEALHATSYDVVLNCLDRHAPAADAAYAEERLRMYFNLAHHADLYGRMLYFGSGAEYGRQLPLIRVSEQDFGREIPTDSYGFALFQMATHTLQSANIYNFRLFGIFGPYELWRQRFISNCVCKALFGYPLTIRQDRMMDFLYTDDLCKIIRWALDAELRFHTYNATSGQGYRLSNIGEKIVRQSGCELPIYIANEGFASEYTSDNTRLVTEMPHLLPTEPIDESIRKLFAFYRATKDTLDRESLLYNL
jgi:GDP-L-fucose synthase